MEPRPKGKILFLAVAVCILFSVVFAETVAVDNYDHDCIGEGCSVCLQIETARNFIKTLKMTGFALFSALCLLLLTWKLQKRCEYAYILLSPVTLKVRFNS